MPEPLQGSHASAENLATVAAQSPDTSWLYNEDLAPIPLSRRTWGTYNYAALWVAMSVNIPTYMLASGMIAGGMNWKQAVFTVFLGNVLVLVPMLLNAHAGARYGIPFPVFARSSFGVLGANIPAILRALVACGWFGIQTWIGGQAISAMIGAAFPAWKDFSRAAGMFHRILADPRNRNPAWNSHGSLLAGRVGAVFAGPGPGASVLGAQ